VSERLWGERRRESRLHRFGLGLGWLLAVLFHAALFWGPEVPYRPALEEARVRRVLVAQPYRPAPAPTPVRPERPAPPPEAAVRAEKPAADPAPSTPSPAPAPGGRDRPRAGVAERALTDAGLSVASAPREDPGRGRAPAASPEEWKALLAELQARGQEISASEAEPVAQARGGGAEPGAEGPAGEGGYLDPRIRMKVVSYPPTSVEAAHPAILYPDLRFHRRQLQAGICRVYYRVWTDRTGRIVKAQVKTPSTREEQERYSPFVEAVEESVAEWPFDRAEAEVHVDVLFEIE